MNEANRQISKLQQAISTITDELTLKISTIVYLKNTFGAKNILKIAITTIANRFSIRAHVPGYSNQAMVLKDNNFILTDSPHGRVYKKERDGVTIKIDTTPIEVLDPSAGDMIITNAQLRALILDLGANPCCVCQSHMVDAPHECNFKLLPKFLEDEQ